MANHANQSAPNTNPQPVANGDGKKFSGPGSKAMNEAWAKAMEKHGNDEALATAAFPGLLADEMAGASPKVRQAVHEREDAPWNLPPEEEETEEETAKERRLPVGLARVEETPQVLARALEAGNQQATSLLNPHGNVVFGHCRRCNKPLWPWEAVFVVGRQEDLDRELTARKKAHQGEWTQEQQQIAMQEILTAELGDVVLGLRSERFKGHAIRAFHFVADNLMACMHVHEAGGEGRKRFEASPSVRVKQTGDVVDDFKRVSCGAFMKAQGWVVVDLKTLLLLTTLNETVRAQLKAGADLQRIEDRKDGVAHRLLEDRRRHREATGQPEVIEMVPGQKVGDFKDLKPGQMTREVRDRVLRDRRAPVDLSTVVVDTDAE